LKPLLTTREAISLLHIVGCSTAVIRHCKSVSNLAVKLACSLKNGDKVNVELIKIGALLHDIGRSKTHKIDHGIVGADIVRSFGLPDSVVRIVERHVGAGIPADEAVKLGLPNRDFIPETLEEKIVSYADKLIENNHEVSYEEALKSLSSKFGDTNAMVNRFRQIYTQLGIGA